MKIFYFLFPQIARVTHESEVCMKHVQEQSMAIRQKALLIDQPENKKTQNVD